MRSSVVALDWCRLRGLLAERRITHKRFALACGLNQSHLGQILNGKPCGELAAIKIQRALAQFGLSLEGASENMEPQRAAS